MADENIIPTESTETTEIPESQKRIQDLSNKVKTSSEERDAAIAAREEAEKKAAFAEGFVDMVSQNPSAKDFKDDIREKVMAGYSVEDATYAVLGKAGKLGAPAPAPQPDIAGGSAPTVSTQEDEKTVATMTQAERRAALMENQAELADALAPKNFLR